MRARYPVITLERTTWYDRHELISIRESLTEAGEDEDTARAITASDEPELRYGAYGCNIISRAKARGVTIAQAQP